jgi:hypothetical protein
MIGDGCVRRSPTRICFATWELKNFSNGGVGVLIHNILKTYADDDRFRLAVLWYGGRSLTAGVFRRAHPNCEFYALRDYGEKRLDSGEFPPASSFPSEAQWRSLRLMLALKEIEERHGAFDVIEFPDFDGAAFATIQEKKLGRAFAEATIAVRIHSTDSILRPYDHRPISSANALRAAFERKALADADVVVAHLRPIAKAVRDAYAMPPDWFQKVRVETPPVLVDAPAAAAPAAFTETTPIVLTSKIQWFKRPEVFVNGAVAFMRQNPDYRGSASVLAHVIDDELRLHCESLIPAELESRVRLLGSVAGEARDRIIGQSVVVVPSAYESFCLVAYEASRLGAIVVLNERNPAFSDDTPWRDGGNCYKFDGTAGGLAATLSRVWRSRAEVTLTAVEAPHARDPYWLSARPQASVGEGERGLSCVVLVSDDFGDPIETIAMLPRSPELDMQIVVVAEFGGESSRRSALLDRVRAVAASADGVVKYAELGFKGGEAALANLGLSLADKDIVAFVRAGFVFDSDFLASAVDALRAHRDFDVVVPQTVFLHGAERAFRTPVIGEALSAATTLNEFGDPEFVARRDKAKTIGFDETLDRYVDWDFHLRACAAGLRYIVSNRAEVRAGELGATARHWRSHLDSVFSKHLVSLGTAKIMLTSIYEGSLHSADGNSATGVPLIEAGLEIPGGLRFSKRSLDYYLREGTPWWRVALKRPIKIKRWLMLREFQKAKCRMRK